MKWEEIIKEGGWDVPIIWRTKLPQGWLVVAKTSKGVSQIVVEDKKHEWGE